MPALTARKDQYRITLNIDGQDYGVWENKTGGKVAANQNPHRTGGMGDQIALGGRPTIDNVVLTTLYTSDLHNRLQAVIDKAGKGQCVVTQMPLDQDKNPWGKPIIWNGTLDSVDFPEADANSTDASMITVEVTPAGKPTSI